MSISIIIPAYNEASMIGRLLTALNDPAIRPRLDVIVVCNGCTDETGTVAMNHPLKPRVFSIEEGSKVAALRLGDTQARTGTRFYVDADVVISASDLDILSEALLDVTTLAVAPERNIRLDQSSWWVRAYYAFWEELPVVQSGLFGRGVLGISESGQSRISDRPDVFGDDLFFHNSFSAAERRVIPQAHAVIQAPQTVGDLIRRRVRATQGNHQQRRSQGPKGSTSISDFLLLLRQPGMLVNAFAFVLTTITARVWARSRRGDNRWLRDESSRRT